MPSQEYHPPVYRIPNHPSRQLKVVFDYLDSLKRWDFDAFGKLCTSDFTQQILPASLGASPRTKNECTESLYTLRDSLNSAPLEVRNAQTLLGSPSFLARRLWAKIIIYDVNESKSKIWVYMFVKSVNIEGIFNFTFGTGKDENLIANLTEFVDSKMYAGGGDDRCDRDRRSSSFDTQPRSEPSTQLDSETHTQAST